MSGSRMMVPACGPAFASTSLNSRSTWLDCHRSASGTAVNSADAAWSSAASHSLQRPCARERFDGAVQAFDVLGERGRPARCGCCPRRRGGVWCRARRASRRTSPHPPARGRYRTARCSAGSRRRTGARCGRSKPHRMLASRTQSAMASRSSSVKLKQARTGRGLREVEDLGGGGPPAGEREQLRCHARAAGWSASVHGRPA